MIMYVQLREQTSFFVPAPESTLAIVEEDMMALDEAAPLEPSTTTPLDDATADALVGTMDAGHGGAGSGAVPSQSQIEALKKRKAHIRAQGGQQSMHSSYAFFLDVDTPLANLVSLCCRVLCRTFVPLSERSNRSRKPSALVTDDMVSSALCVEKQL